MHTHTHTHTQVSWSHNLTFPPFSHYLSRMDQAKRKNDTEKTLKTTTNTSDTCVCNLHLSEHETKQSGHTSHLSQTVLLQIQLQTHLRPQRPLFTTVLLFRLHHWPQTCITSLANSSTQFLQTKTLFAAWGKNTLCYQAELFFTRPPSPCFSPLDASLWVKNIGWKTKVTSLSVTSLFVSLSFSHQVVCL